LLRSGLELFQGPEPEHPEERPQKFLETMNLEGDNLRAEVLPKRYILILSSPKSVVIFFDLKSILQDVWHAFPEFPSISSPSEKPSKTLGGQTFLAVSDG